MEENSAAVFRAGGAALIPITMQNKKWKTRPKIQAEGCLALQNGSFSKVNFRESGKDTGAIHAVVWAMKNHLNDRWVQKSGCGALANFVVLKSNAEYIVKESNGVESIVAAMNKFKDNAWLQKWACWALNNLLRWDDYKEAIKEAGGGLALFEAFKNHKDDSKEHVEDLQTKADSALTQLMT